jgi:tetratricopeptide (TPR) repeat protein
MKLIATILILFSFYFAEAQKLDSLDIKNYYYKYMNSGFLAYQKGDLQNALYFFETAHKTLPKDTASLLNIMHIYLDQKKYDAALITAEKLLAINHHQAPIYSLISSIKLNNGNIAEALKTVDAGLQKNKDNKMLLLMKSNLQLDNNNTIDAINTIKEIISVTSETHYYCNIGQLYESIEEADSAISAYRLCVIDNPGNIDALHGLAFLYFEKGETLSNNAQDLPLSEAENFKQMILLAKIQYQMAKKYVDNALLVEPNNEAIKNLSLRIDRKMIAN